MAYNFGKEVIRFLNDDRYLQARNDMDNFAGLMSKTDLSKIEEISEATLADCWEDVKKDHLKQIIAHCRILKKGN